MPDGYWVIPVTCTYRRPKWWPLAWVWYRLFRRIPSRMLWRIVSIEYGKPRLESYVRVTNVDTDFSALGF